MIKAARLAADLRGTKTQNRNRSAFSIRVDLRLKTYFGDAAGFAELAFAGFTVTGELVVD
jgi:hypothetical protein